MNPDRVIFSAKWFVIRESSRGFQYFERRGKDSIGVFLVRKRAEALGQYDVLIRQQPLCIDNIEIDGMLKLFPCPITGAIEEGESPEVTAVREAYEEGGYTIQVKSLGHYIVGTQTNEICYLYYADVTGMTPDEPPQDGSYFESISRNEWHPLEYLKSCDYSACQIGYTRLQAILAAR
ncbi:MAG: NUDIX domain-containing protein [Oculatellaceae cyanobacterium bins.114]|nr:NUDIX domain-containing protein [Oculatellaceae cyanobacterium bins.114]